MEALNSARQARKRRVAAAVLAGYWIVLFIGTHIPQPELVLPENTSDKLLHFAAYFGLAFLLAMFRSTKRVLTLRDCIVTWAVVAAFAAFDELSQMPVGRDADVLDWLTDMSGAAAGMVLFGVGSVLIGRFVDRRP